jgi:hypothetical protein
MRSYLIAFGLLIQSLLCVAEPYTIVSHTREADYVIGSVARQYLAIKVPLGYRLDEGSLPEQGVTEAIELRDIHWQFVDENNVTNYSFDIDWQIFVAFDTVKSIPLRSLALVFKREGHAISIEIPADSVLVSNLLPPKMDVKHVQPYPDVTPQSIKLTPFLIILFLSLSVLVSALIYIGWYFGWITFPAEKKMPFRQAWRAIRKLTSDEQSVSKALQIISRAFNQYAGYSVTAENLTLLLRQRVDLQPFTIEIKQLYQDIQLNFFAGKSPKFRFDDIKKLSNQLSKLELS